MASGIGSQLCRCSVNHPGRTSLLCGRFISLLSSQVESFLKLSFWVLFYCIFLKEEACFISRDNSYDGCHCQSFKKSLLYNIFMSKYLVNNCSGDTRLSSDFWAQCSSFTSQLTFFMNIRSPGSLQIKYLSCYSIIFF